MPEKWHFFILLPAFLIFVPKTNRHVMRIIGHIEHPHLKITVFKMDNRLSVKFENALYEQTFKFGLDERVESFEDVQKLLDITFIEQVSSNFQRMHQTRITAFGRAFPIENQLVFEEII